MRDNAGDSGLSRPAKTEEPLAAFFDGMGERAHDPKALVADAAIGGVLGVARAAAISGGREVLAPVVAKLTPWVIGAVFLEEGLRRSAKDHTDAGKARAFGQAAFDVGVGSIAQGVGFMVSLVGDRMAGGSLFGKPLAELRSLPRGQTTELTSLINDRARPDLLQDIRNASATGKVPGEGALGPFGGKGGRPFDEMPLSKPIEPAMPPKNILQSVEAPPAADWERQQTLGSNGKVIAFNGRAVPDMAIDAEQHFSSAPVERPFNGRGVPDISTRPDTPLIAYKILPPEFQPVKAAASSETLLDSIVHPGAK